jgi:hypothetical protein
MTVENQNASCVWEEGYVFIPWLYELKSRIKQSFICGFNFQHILSKKDIDLHINPFPYGIWSAVPDMTRGPAGHPCEDDIGKSKDDSGGWLPKPWETVMYLSCCCDTSEPGEQELKQKQESWENFTFFLFLLSDTEHDYLQYNNLILKYILLCIICTHYHIYFLLEKISKIPVVALHTIYDNGNNME